MAKQMWKIRQAAASDGSESDVVQIARDATGPTTTGGLLRATREALGFELRDVAEILRIRYPYLEAIEEDRFDELPGSTYAVGFVRAYAEHLGLDGAEVVLRFRRETDVLNEKPQLVFPAPIVEAKVPGGAVLLIAVFLAVLVYSSWIYVSSQGSTLGSIIPEIQNRVALLIGGGSADQSSPSPTVPLRESLETTTTQLVGDEAGNDATAAAAAESEVQAPPVPSASIQEGAETLVADADDARSTTDTTVSPAVQSVDSDAVAALDASTEEAVLPTLPLDQPPAGPVREPGVYGSENVDARIIIKATSDSWVEIKDVDDALLLTRVMRTGDSFRVPDRSGLTLMTGNAGALLITVDGEAVQNIGPNGAVRRDVKLEPELLKSNTAHIP